MSLASHSIQIRHITYHSYIYIYIRTCYTYCMHTVYIYRPCLVRDHLPRLDAFSDPKQAPRRGRGETKTRGRFSKFTFWANQNNSTFLTSKHANDYKDGFTFSHVLMLFDIQLCIAIQVKPPKQAVLHFIGLEL